MLDTNLDRLDVEEQKSTKQRLQKFPKTDKAEKANI